MLPPIDDSHFSQWTWTTPDLSIVGNFCKERVNNVHTVINQSWLDHKRLFQHGLNILAAYRRNYSLDGPSDLVMGMDFFALG